MILCFLMILFYSFKQYTEMHNNSKLCTCMYPSRAFISELRFTLGPYELKCRHEKINCIDRDEQCNELLTSNYDSQPSGLERGSSDLIYRKNGSTGSAAEAPTIFEQEDEGGFQKVSSFRNDRSNVSLQVHKQKSRRIASERVYLLAEISSAIIGSKRYTQIVPDCKHVTRRNKREITKDE